MPPHGSRAPSYRAGRRAVVDPAAWLRRQVIEFHHGTDAAVHDGDHGAAPRSRARKRLSFKMGPIKIEPGQNAIQY